MNCIDRYLKFIYSIQARRSTSTFAQLDNDSTATVNRLRGQMLVRAQTLTKNSNRCKVTPMNKDTITHTSFTHAHISLTWTIGPQHQPIVLLKRRAHTEIITHITVPYTRLQRLGRVAIQWIALYWIHQLAVVYDTRELRNNWWNYCKINCQMKTWHLAFLGRVHVINQHVYNMFSLLWRCNLKLPITKIVHCF